ncbi:hypothetical protein [Pseudonocardia alaniniphila]|uniref:Uncharacterized protein n=1 Tax=Pseudonocardia alaniniphila TaxID=75291 RepID=A0ABS9THS1_9PSEU|nr:hypothetical protein [Pseudonocardia alaniniphila]MCH6168099.1 hypothetical protein [Pseudonocardia alaniniphila]
MLKKAGIVVAAATAGLLAVAPLAFAGDRGDDSDQRSESRSASSTVGLYDIDYENDSAECLTLNNATSTADNAATSNTLAILGLATSTLTQTLTPAATAAQTPLQTASCNNFTFEDNREDNSTAVTGSLNG